MVLDAMRTFVSRRPGWIVTVWLGVAEVSVVSPEFDEAGGRGAGQDACLGRREPARGGTAQAVVAGRNPTRRWRWRSCTGPGV